MDELQLRRLLDDVASGALAPDEAVARLRRLPFADLGFARVDHHRGLRQAVPEAVYGPGKTAEQCAAIVTELRPFGPPVVLPRATAPQVEAVMDAHPDGRVASHAPGWSTVAWDPSPLRPGRVLVVTAGAADLPAARECRTVLGALGFRPALTADCGVAGVHRLLATVDELDGADAVVVVAGMEGALASGGGGITRGAG